MRATTLKMSDQLRARIEPLARKGGLSPHAWMLKALERVAEETETRERLLDEAEQALADIDAGGPVFDKDEVHRYLLRRRSGGRVARPRSLKASARR